MSKGGSAPAPVDPYQAAAAQYQYGAATANYNTELARPNVSTPYGSIDWSTGQSSGTGAQPINVPGYGWFNGSGAPSSAPAPTPGITSTQPSGGYPANWGAGATVAGPPPGSGPLGGSGLPISSPTVSPVWRGNGAAFTANPGHVSNGTPAATQPGAAAAAPTSTGGTTSAPVDPYALTNANTLTAPQWSENINLSPVQQQLLNTQEGTQLSSGLTGQTLAGTAAQNLSAPITSTPIQTSIDTSGVSAIPGASDLAGFTTQAQNASLANQMQYLQPEENQQLAATKSQLINEGAQPGSAAYDNAILLATNQVQQENTNAENNAVQQGLTEQQALYGEGANTNQQQFGEAATQQGAANTGAAAQLNQELAVRDQPLNELQTEYGLSNPAGVNALGSGAGGGAGSATAPDILSAFNTSAQQGEANYNAGVATSNADTGAAASLASSYLMYLALA